MKNENIIVLSSTHIDSHGWRMAKSALIGAAETINSEKKPRLGIEHDMSLPPLGRLNNAEVILGEDGEFYLIAQKEFFNKHEQINLEDGTVLIKEYFEEGGFPFSEVKNESTGTFTLSYDPNNFGGFDELEKIIDEIRNECGVEFEKRIHTRKSLIPDPELIITVGQHVAGYLGLKALLPKIHEKITESVSENLIENFKKLVKVSASKLIGKSIPVTSPKTFIFSIPGDITVEFIINSSNPDDVVSAFDEEKIKLINSKIESSKKTLNPDKIQFFYNKEKQWELNYILTKLGEVIGTEQSFNKRNVAYRQLINNFLNS